MNDTTKGASAQVELKPCSTCMSGAKNSVRVKALKWQREGGVWMGRSAVGVVYLVDREPYSNVWGWALDTRSGEPKWRDGSRTVGDAKAAAQSHYEKLIMQALA